MFVSCLKNKDCITIGYSEIDENQRSIFELYQKIDFFGIIIANAGVGGDDNILSGNPSEINKILKINFLGVINSVIPFIPTMKRQHSGKIAIISSIAAFRGIPGHGAYSSSKAALQNITESWDYTLKPYGNQEYIPADDCLIIPTLNIS